MRGKWFAAGLLAAVGILAWAVPSRAGDVIRLNGVGNAPTQNLVDDGRGADTIRTWRGGFGGFGRGFGFGGFNRGFGFGGFNRGFGFGGFNRGFGFGGFNRFGFGGFNRFGFGFPGVGLGGLGFRGLGWGGLGWGGLGWGGGGWGMPGWGGWGWGGWPIGGWGGGFWPCAGTTANVYTLSMPMATLGTPMYGAPLQPYIDVNPPQAPRDNGTYPYDGGPNKAVPNSNEKPRTAPLEGRSVSLPKPAGKWTYPAYGETARRISSPHEQTVLTRRESKKPAAR
ncbi:MAG TPA: hypothetical protein VH643_35925 [Gemmataceae bacterium]